MVAALLIAALVAIDPPKPAPAVARMRPLSEIAQRMIDDAQRTSRTIASMIAEIERSDVIVYVDARLDASAGGGTTRFVGVSPSARFLQVTVNLSVAPRRRTEILAHELQHVLEVARAKQVRDETGMERLFREIGWAAGRLQYETAAAVDVEKVVHDELWSARARQRTR